MSVRRHARDEGSADGPLPRRDRRAEGGDTLIEVLLALVVLGLASVALLVAFATSISGAGEHRSLATDDTLLKSFVETAISQIEQQPYQSCATVATYTQGATGFQPVSFTLPSGDSGLGYSVGIDPTQPVTYWNGTSFGSTCVAGSTNPQQITAKVTGPYNTVDSLQFIVDDPLAPPPPVYGAAAQLVFNPAAPGPGTAGVSIPNLFVQVEDTTPQIVTSDWSFATLAIASGPAGGTLSSNCTGAETFGVFQFTNCSVNVAGTYRFVATDSELNPATGLPLTSATSSPFVVSAAGPSQLVFTSQPAGGVNEGTNFATEPVVTVEDSFGNVVNTDTGTVTLSVASYTAGNGGTAQGTLGCTNTTVNAVAGVATFANCQITGNGGAGTYTLSATRSGLTAATSSNVAITAGPGTQLAFTTQPSSAAHGGTAFGVQPVVSVEDASMNVVTTNSDSITLAITNGTGTAGATLTCATDPLAASSGVATYSGCSIDKVGTGYTLTASDGFLAPATSSGITITLGAAAQLVFTTQPVGGVTEGTNFATEPVVSVEDAGGNVVTTDTGTVALSIGSYTAGNGGTARGTLGCNSNSISAVAGVATFANCKITGTAGAGTYTLSATRSGLTSGTSSNVAITAGAGTKLVFTTQPSSAAHGGAVFSSQPVITVEDTNSNTVTTNSDSITLAITNGTGTAGATLTCATDPLAASSGVASFSGCSIDKVGTGYTLTANDGLLAPATSNGITITLGAAAQLVFTTQPVGGVNEAVNFATQPKVTVEDSGGNVVTTDTGAVALSIGSYTAGNGGTTQGTLGCTNNSVSAVAGVATFAGCDISGTAGAGTYTLSATRSGLITGTSSNVVITAGAANKLVFSTQPVGGVTEGTNFATQPVASVEDSNGNVVTTDTGTVALSIASYTAGNGGTTQGTLGCTNTTVNAVAGVATFAGCQITGTKGAGTYTLSATRSGLTTGTSSNVIITAGAGTKVVFTTQPGGGANGANLGTQPVVAVADTNSNTVTSSSDSITLAIASQPGSGATLTCSTDPLAASSGVATFAGCKIVGTIGSYTLTATDGLLAPATSNGITITVGAAAQLVFTTQPVGGVNEAVNFATQPKVTVEDSGGNVVTTDTGAVALSIGSYTAGNGGTTQGTLACTNNSVSAVAGVATFAGCKITGTAGAGTYTLSATRSGLTTGTSSNVAITVGVVNKLAFSTQPVGGVTEGTNFATQPVASVEDSNGNVVTTDTGTVALSIASYTAGNGGTTQGTLGCTNTTVNAVAGVATFAGCQITGTKGAGTYTLSATRSGLTTGTSSNVIITAGAGTKVVFTTQPGGGANGANLGTQPVVAVADTNSNTVTSSSDSITLAIASQPGSGATLTCSTDPLAASSGVATFAGCKIVGTIGSYTLTATDGLLAPATSNGITITVGAAAQLVFTTQPVGGVNEAVNFATQPKVTVEDSGGNVVTTDTGAVALSIGSYTAGNGGTTQGTLACTNNSVSAVAGVATFAGCKITGTAGAGTYTLSATRSGLTTGTSSNVAITTGAATKLVFTTQPAGAVHPNAFTTQPVVAVEDTNGNIVTTNTDTISMAFANNPTSGSVLTCNSVAASSGVATFAGCKISKAGTGYTIKATDATLSLSVTSNAFNVG